MELLRNSSMVKLNVVNIIQISAKEHRNRLAVSNLALDGKSSWLRYTKRLFTLHYPSEHVL